jgi:hypothetical protein
MNDNPIQRAHNTIKRINFYIEEPLNEHPESLIETPSNDEQRTWFHGFMPGDRVTTHRGDQYQYGQSSLVEPDHDIDPPTAYGHVTDIRHGCNPLCRYMCRLVAVNIEGAIPLPSGNTIQITPGAARFRLDQVNHAD